MKIYLSKYWIAGHISLVCVEVVIVVATAAFCIEYRDEENILLIICSLVLIGITYYVQSRVIYLLDYVEVSNNQFTQCSFSGKRKRAVNSDDPIYYQIVPLIEGVYSRADFIVLSNQEFSLIETAAVLLQFAKRQVPRAIKLLCLTTKNQNRYCILEIGIRFVFIDLCYSSKHLCGKNHGLAIKRRIIY